MDTKGKQIAFQVAYKAAVELIAAGVVQLETDDTGAEVAGFATSLFDHLESALVELEGASPKASPSASKPGKSSGSSPRSPRSPRAASATPSSNGPAPSGGPKKAPGDFEFASAGQCKFIEKMIGEKDHAIEYTPDGFEWGEEIIPWDKIPSGYTQEIIDYLKPLNDVEVF
jgi:hypothetical protein